MQKDMYLVEYISIFFLQVASRNVFECDENRQIEGSIIQSLWIRRRKREKERNIWKQNSGTSLRESSMERICMDEELVI